ncbi:MBG domain-containing protein [uncultured Parabacteroides sp.]|uniref:MBG domain-containing protein n=1 Tax=uncultured Parabacteroides sp. TaxID=512312 RepID=UPI0025871684|nr:MBG domain-containing protein [uncultured Parabacteroides sp.]
MNKVYLIDVSRRLLIFVLLLGGYITQAVAADIYVPVKDVLSVYEGTSDANAEQLKAHIQSLLQEVVDLSDQTATISDVTIRAAGSDQTGDLAAGSYNYTFKVTSTSPVTLNFERAIGTGNITPPTLFGTLDHEQVVVTNAIEIKARQAVGNLNFPANWGNYVYGTPISDLSNKIQVSDMSGVSFIDASVFLVKDGVETLYTGNNSLDAGEYDVVVTFPPTEQFAYSPSLSNCTQQAIGSYISTAKLKVKEKPINNTVFPVFAEGVGGLGKMAANTNLNRVKNRINNNINPSDFISEIKVYSDANFSNEVTAGKLAPGAVYSYRVVLLPNYGKGNNVSASVGGATINFNTAQHSYDIVNAISVEKNTLAVKLPDFISSPIRIGDYNDNAAVATMLKQLIQDINPDMVDQNLVPKVDITDGTVSPSMTDNSLLGYKVTIQGDLTKTDLNFVTNGNVASANLTVNGNVCSFKNSLLFVTTLPTTHSLAYPGNYQINYEKNMAPNAVIRRIKSDLLVRNAGVLGNETFVVHLINNDLSNKNAIAETDNSFGYKITITKSATLQEIETPANQRINVVDKNTTIEITYSKSIAIVPRPTIDFTFGEYTVQYVKGMTRTQVADKVRDFIYLANPFIAEHITNVQITNNRITENMGTATYRVTLSSELDVIFSEVTVNGQPHSSSTFEGIVNITPRPIAKVKLYKYEFKKEGASNDMIAKAILADLLLKNPDMKGAYISSVNLIPTLSRDVYSYSVIFNPNDNIQKIEVSNEDGGLIIPIVLGGYTTATYLRSVRLTDDGQSLAEYPLPINVQLPLWERPFGQTADEYAQDLMNDFRLTPGADRVTVPDLNNWGVKTYLINNETSTGDVPVRIAGESYPQVSDLYGYEVVAGANTQFSEYYTLNYTAPGSIHLTKNGNDVIAKLALRIVKAKCTLTLPEVNVTYRDINTKIALLDSIKKAVLEDPANEEFFELVAKTGVKPLKSFTVTINNIEEEGTTVAKTYTYSVAFVQKVTDNIEIREDGLKTLVVGKAAVVFTFPTDITYRYGKRKVAIEADILSQFLAANEGLLSTYTCFENPADLFKVMFTNANCSAEETETLPKNGDYGYRVDVLDANLLSNFLLDNQFGSNFHNVQNSVQIGQRKLTITLPTYLAATAEEGTAAKAAFTFGKATKAEIKQMIYDDIVALNGSKIKSDYTLAIELVTTPKQLDGQNPVIGDYNYTIDLTSPDYTFVYEIEGAEVEVTEYTTAVNAVKVVAPGIVVTFNEEKLEGVWTIVAGKPVYELTNLTLTDKDFGFGLITIKEDPENPGLAMTKARWNQLFNQDKLHWALYNGQGKLRFHGNTLNSVLVDSVKNNITNGNYKLRIVDASTLKAAIGNFEIQLDTDLANLKVTPATVEVKAAEEAYTKVYGTVVTKDSDLNTKLVFATVPKLNAAALQAEKNVIDLFETVDPLDTDVYEATAPVGDYQIRAVDAMVKGMFTPVVGVKFAASETEAKVTVTPAPLTATDLTVKVSVTREYGEEATDADVYVQVSGDLSEAFQAEISKLLNADKVNRTSWLDLSGVNKKTDVGTYELRFTSSAATQIAALLPNFNISAATLINAGLTVTPAPLTVRAKSYNRPYGGGNPDLEIEYIGLKNNEYENLADVFSVMPKIATDARSDSRGTYDIYFTVKGEARNYTVTHENGTLSIDKIRRTIIWPEDQRNLIIPVGETVELSAYLKSEADGKPSIYDIRYELSGNDRERVILSETARGVYAVTGNVRTEGDNYVTITVFADGDDTYEDATPVTGTIKVIAPEGDAAKVNVIISNVTSIYDSNPRAVSVKVTDVETGEAVKDFSIYYEGDQLGSVPTLYPSTQDAPTDAGVYTVTVKATLGSVTYSYTAKNKMVIAPKPVVVTARSFNIQYGNEQPAYANAYDYNKSDFLNGEDFLVGQAPVVRLIGYNGKAGSYKLTPYSAQDFGRNYVITYVSGLLNVSKAAVTIQADNKETVYGKDLEELTYTATGFVNGETLKDLGFAPRISSIVTRTSDAGVYPITFSDNYTSDNYEVSYVDGKYNLLAASQKINWSPETTIDVEGGDVILTATASSKLPVTFNSSNDAVAYVNQIGDAWILTPVTSGTVTVTAMQHGNKNYNAAEPVVITFLVEDEYLSVGNENLVVADQIDVYPRLFTNTVTVAAPSEIKQVELLSMNGTLQIVIRKPGSVIDLSTFGSGIYLLNVTLEDGTFKSVKIIKK